MVVVDFVVFYLPATASYKYGGLFQKQIPVTAPLVALRGSAMRIWIGTFVLAALQLFLVVEMSLPLKAAPPMQTTSGLLRRSTPETSLPSVLPPGLLTRKRPLPSSPSEEEQWELDLRRKLSAQTRGYDAGLPRRAEIRSSAAESLRKPSSMPTADSASGLPRRAGGRKITKTEQRYRDALLREGSNLLQGGASFLEDLGREFGWTALRLFPEERGRVSKTHKFNDSVVLDGPCRTWLGPMAENLAARRRGKALFNFTYAQWLNSFKSAAARLGLESWELTSYVLRHTGLSHDHLSGARSFPAIQRRGRWALESPVRRYEKSSRVTSRLKDLPADPLAFSHRCDRHLGSILDGSVAVPQLPPVRAKRRKLVT